MIEATEIAAIARDLVTIPFYPREDHDVVLRQLGKFVDRPERLRWLVDTAVASMRAWAGIVELRGLYCTRFPPADGHEENCSLPGFTAADSEARGALEEYKQKQLPAAPASEFGNAVAALADAKRMAV